MANENGLRDTIKGFQGKVHAVNKKFQNVFLKNYFLSAFTSIEVPLETFISILIESNIWVKLL